MSDMPMKAYQTAEQKQDCTDEAYRAIQGIEKSASDAKSARLKESRLRQEAEDKAAPPKKNTRKARAK